MAGKEKACLKAMAPVRAHKKAPSHRLQVRCLCKPSSLSLQVGQWASVAAAEIKLPSCLPRPLTKRECPCLILAAC